MQNVRVVFTSAHLFRTTCRTFFLMHVGTLSATDTLCTIAYAFWTSAGRCLQL
jgi:hypothetical protein